MIEIIKSFFGSDDTKIYIGLIAAVVGIILTIAKIKVIFPRPRLYLKEDIDIRNSLNTNEKEYEIVSDYVKARIRDVYSDQDKKPSDLSILMYKVLGAMMIASGIYLTIVVENLEEWSKWWWTGTIYLILLGIGLMYFEGFDKSRKNKSKIHGQKDDNEK